MSVGLPEVGFEARVLVDRAELLVDTDPREALRLLDAVHYPTLRHESPATSGRAAYLRAVILRDRGDQAAARDSIESARHDFVVAGSHLDAWKADIVRAAVIRDTGDAARSVEIITNILESLPARGGNRELVSEVRARAHSHLAPALSTLGDHTEALRHHDLAWNRLHILGDDARRAGVERARGMTYLGLGMTHRALDDLERAHRTLDKLGHQVAAARCAIPISQALIRLDRASEAIRLLENARLIFEQHGAVPRLAEVGIATSEALLYAGHVHDARIEADAAADLFLDLHRVVGSARARFIAGTACLLAGDGTRGATQFALAERLFQHGDRVQLAFVWLAQALIAARNGEPDRAVRLASSTLEVATAAGEAILMVEAQLMMAYAAPGDAGAGPALERATAMIDTHELTGLDLARALARARIACHEADLETSASELRAALAREDDPAARADGSSRSVAHTVLGVLAVDDLVSVLLQQATQGSTIEAWRWASGRMPRPARDPVAARRADAPDGHGSVRVTPSSELLTLSNSFDELLDPSSTRDPQRLNAVRIAVRRLMHRGARIARRPFVSPASMVRLPVPEGPVLQYHLLGDDVVVFVIREGQVYSRTLPSLRRELDHRLVEWQAECSRMAHLSLHGRRHATTDDEMLGALTKMLVDPVSDLLDDLVGSALVVITDGPLTNVPFEALRLGEVALAEAFSLRFGSDLHDVVTNPPAEPCAAVHGKVLALLSPDARAPRIADEAKEIRRIHADATILLAERATTDALVELAEQHAVVHIACHGMFWSEHPSWSALRLGDRWITASEIKRMPLRGKIVVLNACATGQGRDAATESLGLVPALLAAGSRGVVATSWPVDDEVALVFARHFHMSLAAGRSPGEAVGLANREIAREQSAHPWAWAAYRYVSAGSHVLHDACHSASAQDQ